MTAVDWSGTARADAEITAVGGEFTDLLSVACEGSHDERAQVAGRLALLSAREAAWWRVLAHRTPIEVPFVYRHAAILAHVRLKERAQRYRDHATSWRELAICRAVREHAAALDQIEGSGSGGELCGVTR